ncbi:MAG: hypothetical protein L3J07_04245 [Candidatus Magasanikbacteria bacterium]|nr:hypothetical protein [Candidatus Magasanikbacteria bacterium]
MILACGGAGPGMNSQNMLLTEIEIRQIARKYGFKKWRTAELGVLCNFVQNETEYFKYFGYFEVRSGMEELVNILLKNKINFTF